MTNMFPAFEERVEFTADTLASLGGVSGKLERVSVEIKNIARPISYIPLNKC